MTAQLNDGIEPAKPAPATPTAMVAQWFPAFVALPDGQPVVSARVMITDTGLFVFSRRPPNDDIADATFASTVDWSKMGSRPAPRLAFTVHTTAGEVGVTPQMGCGCHMKPLKNWVPPWGARSIPWGGPNAS